VKATFDAISKTYGFLTPDLWTNYEFSKSPFSEHAAHLLQDVVKPTKDSDRQ
jgi:small subunit ribosomal protein S2e